MSRIGKMPVVIPEKVTIKTNGQTVSVKGPKGEIEYTFTDKVKIKQSEKEITISPVDDTKLSRSLWGTTRTLINNMVVGTSTGFNKTLVFTGVGYKAVVKGNSLVLNLGFSHPIDFKLPKGISAKVTKNVIDITGIDKSEVGLIAAKIRAFRPPEPYKGKGIKYSNETIIRKAGKSGAKK